MHFNLISYSSYILGRQNKKINLLILPVMISVYSVEKATDIDWYPPVEVKGK